ncbi:hypothetical protein AncyloWKF20_09470 [Ancylobacter sp. WKF20]|uniref:hypothetical protein n=1 Tax=Ancylobacter sp. WKF20 TaxID=3039801 RepID=UPI0024341AD4|nr:hypothetical protein [Ancylobacter sp. WKF20]WGD32021.1 hypothetical protein AncyloWKF20_09470 [Ancylobacter sp. WKF20]
MPFPSREEMSALRCAGISQAILMVHPLKAVDTTEGRRAFVLAVEDRFGDVVDLLAWLTDDPAACWTLEGRAVLLGESALDEATLDPGVVVHRTPLAWLADGCTGIVILDRAKAWRRLAEAHALIAEDVDHAREVQRLAAPPAATVFVRSPDHKVAA